MEIKKRKYYSSVGMIDDEDEKNNKYTISLFNLGKENSKAVIDKYHMLAWAQASREILSEEAYREKIDKAWRDSGDIWYDRPRIDTVLDDLESLGLIVSGESIADENAKDIVVSKMVLMPYMHFAKQSFPDHPATKRRMLYNSFFRHFLSRKEKLILDSVKERYMANDISPWIYDVQDRWDYDSRDSIGDTVSGLMQMVFLLPIGTTDKSIRKVKSADAVF